MSGGVRIDERQSDGVMPLAKGGKRHATAGRESQGSG